MTEYFLKNGYRVIYFHRKGCWKPFIRNYTLLDYPKVGKSVESLLDEYETELLMLEFVNLEEYLDKIQFLVRICDIAESLIVVLAAAVSDFYLSDIPEHKIQQTESLTLTLERTPKIIPKLTKSKGFFVTFKLETDSKLLDMKAKKALDQYKHELVVGNILDERNEWVKMYTLDNSWILRKDCCDLEEMIVNEIIKLSK